MANTHIARCFASYNDAMACLREGSDKCACVKASSAMQQCLGKCKRKAVQLLCASATAQESITTESMPPNAECREDEAATKTKECVTSDAETLQCLNDGKDRCLCIRSSRSVKSCLGGCWGQIEAALCTALFARNVPVCLPPLSFVWGGFASWVCSSIHTT